MLCATIAVAAAIEATRHAQRASRWIAVSAAASVATIWLHYTGLLVIAPLAVYVFSSQALPSAARRGYLIACGAALAIVGPLMVTQLTAGHEGGVAPYGRLTVANLARVVGTPFDGRFPPRSLTYVTGAIAIAGASISLLWIELGRDRVGRDRRLILAVALAAPAAFAAITIGVDLLGKQVYDSLITRYTAVAAPFMAVALGWALVSAGRPVAIALGALAAISAISGLKATYSPANFPLNLRSPFARITRDYRAGDAVVLAGAAAVRGQADYYLAHLSIAHPTVAELRAVGAEPELPPSGARVWVVTDTASVPAISAALAGGGWHPVSSSPFVPAVELILARR